MDLLLKQFEQAAAILFLTGDGGGGSAFTREGDLHDWPHGEMIAQIYSGDPDLAEQAVRDHIRSHASGRIVGRFQ